MAEKKQPHGYAGSITHAGAQQVQGPFAGGTPQGKTVKRTGEDLRTTKSR